MNEDTNVPDTAADDDAVDDAVVYDEIADSAVLGEIPPECRGPNATTTFATDPPPPPHRYHSFTCWLYFLRIAVPNQSFRSHMVTVQLHDLVCANFTLQRIQSFYQDDDASSHNDTTLSSSSLALGVANVSATCTGSYHATGGFTGKIHAVLATPPPNHNHPKEKKEDDDEEPRAPRFHHHHHKHDPVDPTQHDPIRLVWEVSSSTHNSLGLRQPDAVQTTACHSTLVVPTLHFSGSLSAHMVDWFRHSIQHYVQDEISQQVCPALQELVDPLVSSYLHSVTDFLNQHLVVDDDDNDDDDAPPEHHEWSRREPQQQQQDQGPLRDRPDAIIQEDDPDDDDSFRKDAVAWSTQAPLLTHALSVGNAFVRRHLHYGLLPTWLPSLQQPSSNDDQRSCGFFFHGVNGVIRALLELQDQPPFDTVHAHDDDDDDKDPDNDDDDDKVLWYSMPLPHRLHNLSLLWPGYGALHVNVSTIALSGLDQWNQLQLFETSADDYFVSRLQTDQALQIRIQAALNVSSIPGGMFSGPQDLHEEFTLELQLGHLDWNATLALWVDPSLWHTNVTTGVLLNVLQGWWDNDIPMDSLQCLLESVLDFTAPELAVQTALESMRIVPTLTTATNGDPPVVLTTAQVLEQDLDDLFNNALELLIQGYPDYISHAIAGLVQGPVRLSLEDFLRRLTNASNYDCNDDNDDSTHPFVGRQRDDEELVCPPPPSSPSDDMSLQWLNFSKVMPLQQLQTFLSHPKTLDHLNRYIQCTADSVTQTLLEDQHSSSWNLLARDDNDDDDDDDVWSWWGNTINNNNNNKWHKEKTEVREDKEMTVEFHRDRDPHAGLYRLNVTNMYFQNIGQIDSLNLLAPTDDGLSLSNAVSYGTNEPSTAAAVQVPQLVLQLDLHLPNITATANITLFWNDLALADRLLLHYNVNQLKSFGLARVFEHGHCLLVPVDDFLVSSGVMSSSLNGENASFAIGLFAANVSTSVTLQDNKNEDANTNETMTYTLTTLDYPVVQDLVQAMVGWAADSGRDFVNLASVYSLSEAFQLCTGHETGSPHHDDTNTDDDHDELYDPQELWSMILIVATMLVLAQPVVLLLQEKSALPNHGGSNGGADPNPEESANPMTQPLLDPGMGDDLVNGTNPYNPFNDTPNNVEKPKPALLDSPHIALHTRIGLPMLILVTIFILLSSNLSVGASVELTAVIGRKTLELPSLFEFTLFGTAHEMWNAGIYPVFFLVVVFSGIWPYAKLVIMLICFVSRKIQDGPRGQLLLALDSLGKFSLVDTYVLVLMMVAFRYHLRFFDGDVIGLDVAVVPHYGFYGFLLATTLSLGLGHDAVYCHRLAESVFPTTETEPTTTDENAANPSTAEPPQSLLYHSFHVNGTRRQLSRLCMVLLLLLWMAAAILLGIGITKTSFVFEFGGLAGLALGEENRRTAYSLVSLGTSIPASSHSTVGTYILMTAYFFYAVVAPFACLYWLFILLVFPMNVKRQLDILFLAEIANAWSAVEVFCLSIVASLLEISTFASFIIGDRCETINEVVQDYWPSDADLSDANCFTVQSSVEWNAGYLIGGALLNSFVVSITMRLVHTAMNDRIQRDGPVATMVRGTSLDVLSSSSAASGLLSSSRWWLRLLASSCVLGLVFSAPCGQDRTDGDGHADEDPASHGDNRDGVPSSTRAHEMTRDSTSFSAQKPVLIEENEGAVE